MSVLEKLGFGKIINGDDIDDTYSPDVDVDETEEEESAQRHSVRSSPDYGSVRPMAGAGVSMSSGSSIEMKVVKPDSFETVTQIADLLLSKKTVLLNLEDTNKETARRLIDFLSGIAYAIEGDLKRIANNTFVITPHNVAVSDERVRQETEAKEY
jgi:Uncharacterized protein conserved in bacteria